MAKKTMLEQARAAYSKNQNTKYKWDNGKKTKKKKKKKAVASHYGQVEEKSQNTEKNRTESRKKTANVLSVKDSGSSSPKKSTPNTNNHGTRSGAVSPASKSTKSTSGSFTPVGSSAGAKQRQRRAGQVRAQRAQQVVGDVFQYAAKDIAATGAQFIANSGKNKSKNVDYSAFNTSLKNAAEGKKTGTYKPVAPKSSAMHGKPKAKNMRLNPRTGMWETVNDMGKTAHDIADKMTASADKEVQDAVKNVSDDKTITIPKAVDKIPLLNKTLQSTDKQKKEAEKQVKDDYTSEYKAGKADIKRSLSQQLDDMAKEKGISEDTVLTNGQTFAEYKKSVLRDAVRGYYKDMVSARDADIQAIKDSDIGKMSKRDVASMGIKGGVAMAELLVPYVGTAGKYLKAADAIMSGGKALTAAESGSRALTAAGKNTVKNAVKDAIKNGDDVATAVKNVAKTISKSDIKNNVKREILANALQDATIGTAIDYSATQKEGLSGKDAWKYMGESALMNAVIGAPIAGVAGRIGKAGRQAIAKDIQKNINNEFSQINKLDTSEGLELIKLQMKESRGIISESEKTRLDDLSERVINNRSGVAQIDTNGKLVVNDNGTVKDVMSPKERKEFVRLQTKKDAGIINRTEVQKLNELGAKVENAYQAVQSNAVLAVRAANAGGAVNLDNMDSAVNFYKRNGNEKQVKAAVEARTKTAMKQFNADKVTAKFITTTEERSGGNIVIRPMSEPAAKQIFGLSEGQGFDGVTATINGKKVVFINPNSKRGTSITLAHELTHHAIDGVDDALLEENKFIKLMKDYSGKEWEVQKETTRKPYDKYLERVKNGEVDGNNVKINIDEETACDLMAKYLDERRVDYFKHLMGEDKPLFKRMLDYFRNIVKNDSEIAKDKQFKELSDMFESAYRGESNGETGVKFKLSEDKQTLHAGKGSANEYLTMEDSVKAIKNSGFDEDVIEKVRKETGWYYNKGEDKWQFDIDVSNIKLKNGVKNLKKDAFGGILGEELDGADAFFLNYPDLKDISISFGDDSGFFDTFNAPYLINKNKSGTKVYGISLNPDLTKKSSELFINSGVEKPNTLVNDTISDALQDIIKQMDEGELEKINPENISEDLFDKEGVQKLTNMSKKPVYKKKVKTAKDLTETLESVKKKGKQTAEEAKEAYAAFKERETARFNEMEQNMDMWDIDDEMDKLNFSSSDNYVDKSTGEYLVEKRFEDYKRVLLENGDLMPTKDAVGHWGDTEDFAVKWAKEAGVSEYDIYKELSEDPEVNCNIECLYSETGYDRIHVATCIKYISHVADVSNEKASRIYERIWNYTGTDSKPGSYGKDEAELFNLYVDNAPAYLMEDGDVLYHGIQGLDTPDLLDKLEELFEKHGAGFVLSSDLHANSGVAGAASSWTNELHVGKSFANWNYLSKYSILVRCHNCISGTSITHLSTYGTDEGEVLFGTHTQWTVLNVERVDDKHMYVDVIEKAPQSAKPQFMFALTEATGETPEELVAAQSAKAKWLKSTEVDGKSVIDADGNITKEAADAYMKAAKSNDRKTAWKYVQAALNARGYNIGAYHGSDYFGFTKFVLEKLDDNRSIFTSKSPRTAATYIHGGSYKDVKDIAKAKQKGETQGIYRGRLKMDKPLVVDAKGKWWNQIFVNEMATDAQKKAIKKMDKFDIEIQKHFKLQKMTDEDFVEWKDENWYEIQKYVEDGKSKLFETTDDYYVVQTYCMDALKRTRQVNEWAEKNGYDGVIFKNLRDYGDGNNWEEIITSVSPNGAYNVKTDDVYAVFKPNQFKSSDPITRDGNGNIIPLTMRGDPNIEDVRFAMYLSDDSNYLGTTKGKKQPLIDSGKIIQKQTKTRKSAAERELDELIADAEKTRKAVGDNNFFSFALNEGNTVENYEKALAKATTEEEKAAIQAKIDELSIKETAEASEKLSEAKSQAKPKQSNEPEPEPKPSETSTDTADTTADTSGGEKYTRPMDLQGVIDRSRRRAGKDEMNETAIRDLKAMVANHGSMSDFAKTIIEDGAFGKFKGRTRGQAFTRAKQMLEKDGYETMLENYRTAGFEKDPYDLRAEASTLLAEIGRRLDAGDGDAGQLWADAYNIVEKNSSVSTFGSRALNAQKEFLTATPEGRLRVVHREIEQLEKRYASRIKKINPDGKLVVSQEKLDRLAAATGLEKDELLDEINKDIWEQIPASLMERLNEYRHCFMLFNARTHGRNLIGNGVFRFARAISDEMEQTILNSNAAKKRIGKLRGGKDASDVIINRQRVSRKELKDNNMYLYNEFRAVYDKSGSRNKYIELGRPDGVPTVKFKAMQKLIDLNYSLLEKEDLKGALIPAFNKSYLGYCKARCAQKLKKDVRDISGEELRKFMENMTAAQKDKARHFALMEGEYATFRDSCAFSDWLTGAKQTFAGKEASTRWGTYGYRALDAVLEGALPFVKTPVNIFRRSMDFSPMTLMRSVLIDLPTAKSAEEFQAGVHRLCTGMTGTAMMGVGVLLAQQGLVTVKAGEESGDAYYDRDMGFQDYSVKMDTEKINKGINKVGDILGLDINLSDGKQYSWTIDWASPMNMSLFLGASFQKAFDKDGFDNTAALNAFFACTSPITDMSFMSSPKDTVQRFMENATRGTDGKETDFAGALAQLIVGDLPKNYVSGFFPQLTAQVAGFTDPTQRDTKSTKENVYLKGWQSSARQLASRTITVRALSKYADKHPELKKNPVLKSLILNPKINREGKDVKNDMNVATRLVNAFLNPANVKEITMNDTDRALIEIRNNIEDKNSNDYKYFYYNFTGSPQYALANGKRMTYQDAYKYGKANRIEQNERIKSMLDAPSYKGMTWKMKADEVDDAHWIGTAVADKKTYGANYAMLNMLQDNEKEVEAVKEYKRLTKGDGRTTEEVNGAYMDYYIDKERLVARSHATGDDLYRIKGIAAIQQGDDSLVKALDIQKSKLDDLNTYWGKSKKKYGKLVKTKVFEELSDGCCRIMSNCKYAEIDNPSKGIKSASAGMVAKGYTTPDGYEVEGSQIPEDVYRALGHSWNSAQAGAGLMIKYNKDDKYSIEKLSEMKSTLRTQFDENESGSINKSEVISYIDSLGIESDDEKACLYEVLYNGGRYKNPYKSQVDDHLKWGENRDDEWGDGTGGGHGRRRRGRRGGWGHGGGGSGGGSGEMPTTATGSFKGTTTAGKVTRMRASNPFTATNYTTKSTLNEAYRKKARKLRENTSKKMS